MTTLSAANASDLLQALGGVAVQSLDESAKEKGLALGIYGPGGVGKTTLAATITNSELGAPALHLDCRGNPHVIASKRDKIATLPITKYEQLEAIRKDIMQRIPAGTFPFKTIILDTITAMWSIRLRELYGAVADLDWTKHSASTADVLQTVGNFYDLREAPYKLNVIFIFQETPEKRTIRGQKDQERSEIMLNKALQSQLPAIVNFMGRLWSMEDTAPYRRMLDFKPIETQTQAKFQVDREDELTKVIPMELWDPDLGPLLDTIRGRKPWPVGKYTRVQPKS